jgi:ATP-dependent helicase/nuclease subunit A
MSTYARALQSLGIPHQVTGGAALNEVDELQLLLRCVQALAHPQDPIRLLAALRSGLFGVDDRALYALKRADGVFDYRRNVPESVPESAREQLQGAFEELRRYGQLLALMPPAVAVRRMAAGLGLLPLAAAAEGGNVQAGSLARALELLHGASAERWSAAEVAEFLRELAQGENEQDGLPARQHEVPPVRVMNLHKVKGLQAPVTFLADPSGETDHPPHLHVRRGRDTVEGHMCASVKRGRWHYETIAQPADWAELADHEKNFENAEAIRLLYVAATRAAAELAVSVRPKGKSKNPWSPLEEYLKGCVPMEDPGPRTAPERESAPLPEDGPERAREDAARRATAVRDATYRVEAVKATALDGATAPERGLEHGTEWGAVIHTLLEARMRNPEADIESLAAGALRENGMGEERAEEAVNLVRSVTRSEIWKRAREADVCLVEVPFELRGGENEQPVLRRGVVDLAFREPDGWVICDYKTDAAAAFNLDGLAAHYAPQVHAYARAWTQATDEPVKETCLYFSAAEACIAV